MTFPFSGPVTILPVLDDPSAKVPQSCSASPGSCTCSFSHLPVLPQDVHVAWLAAATRAPASIPTLSILTSAHQSLKTDKLSSGQDGGVDRNPLLPLTTKRRITTNLKSINNQKCQKIELHGTLTTPELKKQLNNNQTRKAADCGCVPGCCKAAGCVGGADLRGN